MNLFVSHALKGINFLSVSCTHICSFNINSDCIFAYFSSLFRELFFKRNVLTFIYNGTDEHIELGQTFRLYFFPDLIKRVSRLYLRFC